MADVTIKTAWNKYYDAFETEPSDAQHLFQESLNYAFKIGGEDCAKQITFNSAKMIYNVNKGNGKIPTTSHIAHIPTEEEIESLLDEIQDEEKTKNDNKTYLFYAASMKSLAAEIQNKSANSIELGSISASTLNDGFPDLVLNNTDNIRSADVIFLADLSDPKTIFQQYAIMCALPRYLANSIKILIAYFPTGKLTIEKDETRPRERITTSNTLACLLSSIPHAAKGNPVELFIYDMHTLQNRLNFTDNVLIQAESCTVLVQEELKKLSNCCVVFPDEGAYERYHTVFSDWPQVLCTKAKDGNKTTIKLKEGEIKDQNVVIVDDLAQSGDTVANCAQLMKDNKCKSVSCFVVHAVFPDNSWRRFCKKGKNEGLLDTFYVTNTIPKVSDDLKQHPPFKVLSLSSVYTSIICDSSQDAK